MVQVPKLKTPQTVSASAIKEPAIYYVFKGLGGWVGLKNGNLFLTFSKAFSTVFILSYIVGGWVAQKKVKIMLT